MTMAVFTGACLSGSIGNSNLKGALYFHIYLHAVVGHSGFGFASSSVPYYAHARSCSANGESLNPRARARAWNGASNLTKRVCRLKFAPISRA